MNYAKNKIKYCDKQTDLCETSWTDSMCLSLYRLAILNTTRLNQFRLKLILCCTSIQHDKAEVLLHIAGKHVGPDHFAN